VSETVGATGQLLIDAKERRMPFSLHCIYTYPHICSNDCSMHARPTASAPPLPDFCGKVRVRGDNSLISRAVWVDRGRGLDGQSSESPPWTTQTGSTLYISPSSRNTHDPTHTLTSTFVCTPRPAPITGQRTIPRVSRCHLAVR
jgi:hypothetical protein